MICDFIFEYFVISFYLTYDNNDYAYAQRHIPAHSGTISNIIFIEEGSKIVTAGRTDGSIIVWKVLKGSWTYTNSIHILYTYYTYTTHILYIYYMCTIRILYIHYMYTK